MTLVFTLTLHEAVKQVSCWNTQHLIHLYHIDSVSVFHIYSPNNAQKIGGITIYSPIKSEGLNSL